MVRSLLCATIGAVGAAAGRRRESCREYLHLVAHSKRGSGVTVMALVDQAACNKSACGDYVKLLQDLTAENLKGLNVQPTTNPSAAVGAHFERQRGGA